MEKLIEAALTDKAQLKQSEALREWHKCGLDVLTRMLGPDADETKEFAKFPERLTARRQYHEKSTRALNKAVGGRYPILSEDRSFERSLSEARETLQAALSRCTNTLG